MIWRRAGKHCLSRQTWTLIHVHLLHPHHHHIQIIIWSSQCYSPESHVHNCFLNATYMQCSILCKRWQNLNEKSLAQILPTFPPIIIIVPTSILLRLIMFVIDRVEDTTKRPRVSACAPPGTLRPFCNVAAVAEEGKKYKSGQFHK